MTVSTDVGQHETSKVRGFGVVASIKPNVLSSVTFSTNSWKKIVHRIDVFQNIGCMPIRDYGSKALPATRLITYGAQINASSCAGGHSL